MSPISQAVLSSWSFDPKIALAMAASLILYVRGWPILHRSLPKRFPAWRFFAFAGGLAALWLAIASPLDAFSGFLLSAHMVQHLLLMSVVPPLILLGSPLLPLLRGLPRKFARDGVGPFLVWPALRRVGNRITHPVTCWIVMAVTLCAWHTPAAFDLALRSGAWHKVEHACFLGASLLFWWPVVRPFPSRPHWPLWSVPLYLLGADLVNTGLSAILTFSDRVLYQPYLEAPRLFGTTALGDQTCAGVIMWVPGSLVFLIPAAFIAIQYLSPGRSLVRPQQVPSNPNPGTPLFPAPTSARLSGAMFQPAQLQSAVTERGFDLLSVPVVGGFLRAQSSRRAVQATLLVIAIAVIADGLFGPQVSSMNLAGVLPWTYWRALVVVILLAAGNFFCMACPFMLVRDGGRRLGLRQHTWPQALRSKWFAIALLVLFFWGYEVFGLWDKPIWTAWLIINYFLVAFAIDALFRGASFCKYVCPIGQFQFVASLVSPLEVKVREPGACSSCKTHDCLRGNERQRGCEMDLHLPRKSGNLDCTFCLDCVRACPHDNIGLMVAAPGMDVVRDPQRASIGRLSRRLDIAALALVFVFAAFANAAFMTAPVVFFEDNLAARLGLGSRLPVTGVLLLIALVPAPAVLAFFAARISHAASHVSAATRELFCRLSTSLVPLGVAMWAAHFLFHFSVGWQTAWPVLRRAANDIGLRVTKLSKWENPSPLLDADAMHVFQTLVLDAGLLMTLYLAWRIARMYAPQAREALRIFAPWAGVATALYVIGVWIFLQPMELRGISNAIAQL
ncbi:MAG TPA: cytochrome c oxidase assembly protein [Candidatus Cybelea sp.]|jgi:cytochrome c oxidase assembly factor CtaG|nr:cytochrome c oxidase assembly protein [Candidatus Cybelea sp.]